ncbi:MAG TPA: hypothetical protein VJQ56_09270 [Blastocatellia bacterium]|nr:hypothetical protein [Blastocatellia bacterium]
MSREKPQYQTLDKHPEEYQRDLNPNAMAGQNIGTDKSETGAAPRTAFDVKPVHRRLQTFSDDALKEIRILAEGTRLEQGATYIDLKQQQPEEFTARGDMTAGPENWYVDKKDVHYETWNRLIGIDDPKRTGVDMNSREANES